jgi:hypothetical protein
MRCETPARRSALPKRLAAFLAAAFSRRLS